jgi:hypothetical protein
MNRTGPLVSRCFDFMGTKLQCRTIFSSSAPCFNGDSLVFFVPKSVSLDSTLRIAGAQTTRTRILTQRLLTYFHFLVIYISAFPRDPRRNRLFVYAVFALEIIQLILLTKTHFEIFASEFGNPKAYDRTSALWFSVPFMSGIGLYYFFEFFLAHVALYQ